MQQRELQAQEKGGFSYGGIVIDCKDACKRFHLRVDYFLKRA
jgi:hypothetical protein